MPRESQRGAPRSPAAAEGVTGWAGREGAPLPLTRFLTPSAESPYEGPC